MDNTPSRGVTYGVSGKWHLEEAMFSAKSVKRWMPELSLEIHIDRKTIAETKNIQLDLVFDQVVQYDKAEHARSMKQAAMKHSSFEQTLFLDSDTFLTDRIDELFALLDRFDMAAAHATQRFHPVMSRIGLYDFLGDVPVSFPELSCGVVIFKKNQRMDDFIRHWLELYDRGRKKFGRIMDQGSFRAAVYASDLNFYVLTPEYNFRANVWQVVKEKVKIVHTHGDLETIGLEANKKIGQIRVSKAPANLLHKPLLPKKYGL